MAFTAQGVPFKLTPEDMGSFDIGKAIRSGFDTYQRGAEAKNAPKKLAEALYAQQLQNKINKSKAEHAEEMTLADLAHSRAGTGLINQQLSNARTKSQMQQENPFFGQKGAAGQIGLYMYLQKHPDLLEKLNQGQGQQQNFNAPQQEQMPPENLGEEQSFIPSLVNEQQAPAAGKPNYMDRLRNSIQQSLISNGKELHGDARVAADIEELKAREGENSPQFKNAMKLFNANIAGKERNASGLKKGENFIVDPESHEIIGKERVPTQRERDTDSGRAIYNYVAPYINKLSEFQGKGSINKFENAAKNYGKDEKSTRMIDDLLLAEKLLPAGVVNEAATLAAGKQKNSYTELKSTFAKTDVPKFVQRLRKEFSLPSAAFVKSGERYKQIINEATDRGKSAVQPTFKEYYPGKSPNQNKVIEYVRDANGRLVPT